MFPKIVGFPPNHPLKNMVFHSKSSILGCFPIFGNTQMDSCKPDTINTTQPIWKLYYAPVESELSHNTLKNDRWKTIFFSFGKANLSGGQLLHFGGVWSQNDAANNLATTLSLETHISDNDVCVVYLHRAQVELAGASANPSLKFRHN